MLPLGSLRHSVPLAPHLLGSPAAHCAVGASSALSELCSFDAPEIFAPFLRAQDAGGLCEGKRAAWRAVATALCLRRHCQTIYVAVLDSHDVTRALLFPPLSFAWVLRKPHVNQSYTTDDLCHEPRRDARDPRGLEFGKHSMLA